MRIKVFYSGVMLLVTGIVFSPLPHQSGTLTDVSPGYRLFAETFFKKVAFADAGSHMIDEVFISETATCANVTVAFNYPVRYDRHYPSKMGGEVRIKIHFLGVAGEDREFIFDNESVMPPPNKLAALTEVTYEGDIEGGPFLNLLFTKKMAFRVLESKKNRAITVLVSNVGEESFCSPREGS